MPDSFDDAFFRHVCLHAGVALIATDAQLKIRFWNPAASRIFGSSPEAMIGRPLIEIVPGEHRELAERLLQRALIRGEPSTFEFAHRNPAGGPIYLAISVSPVIDDAGRHVGVSVYIRDVTRRIESERALADATRMSALGTMAAGLADRFNNLLGGLITSADFAQTSDDPQTLRRALGSIVASLTRASKLTQALLTFAGGDYSDIQPADVYKTVQDFLASLKPRLADQNIRLEATLSPVRCQLPLKRLTTILSCLTANACEAMPAGGTLQVELRLTPDNGQLLLRICDTGVGMSEDDLRHVCEPFFTTKSDDTGSAEHPGLGLAVVHGLVRSLGGTVILTSGPGEGTICNVRIPLKNAAAT